MTILDYLSRRICFSKPNQFTCPKTICELSFYDPFKKLISNE